MRQLAFRLRDNVAALERRIGGRDTGPGSPIRLTAPDAVSEYLLPCIQAGKLQGQTTVFTFLAATRSMYLPRIFV